LSYRPRKKLPVVDWFKEQGRFSHLIRPENEELLDKLQVYTDREWEDLVARCGGE